MTINELMELLGWNVFMLIIFCGIGKFIKNSIAYCKEEQKKAICRNELIKKKKLLFSNNKVA